MNKSQDSPWHVLLHALAMIDQLVIFMYGAK